MTVTGKQEELVVNMGPQHPSTHGVFRVVVTLDGEKVTKAVPYVGYLHRGFEKLGEMRRYTQYLPYPDRWDYVAAMTNEAAYVGAVEVLLGVKPPRRADYLRVIAMELNRLASHLLWYGTFLMDVGALSPFLYSFRDREMILELLNELTGARMTYNYFRFGGVAADTPPNWLDEVADFVPYFRDRMVEHEKIIVDNPIFQARVEGVGLLSREDALNCGVSGPMLRASGVQWDLRKDRPYSVYPEFNFNIPVRYNGDILDRFHIRIREMHESISIIEQAVKAIPGGPIQTPVGKVIKPPPGEAYFAVESPRGELGVYLKSNGTDRAERLHIRAPSFVNLTAFPAMVKGHLVADVIAVLGSTDILLGEVDR